MTDLDMVNHPPHYTGHPSGVEVIEYTRLLPFGPGNAVKYVMRRDDKHTPLTDLDKAEWYLNDCINNEITYDITPKMVEVISDVILAEPNPTVLNFLVAMYHASDAPNWLDKIVGVKPDLELARDLVVALKEEYLT